MSLFGSQQSAAVPPPPPPPPTAPALGNNSISQQSATEKASLLSAEGEGLNGTDLTGGQGATNPQTTKSLLGG